MLQENCIVYIFFSVRSHIYNIVYALPEWAGMNGSRKIDKLHLMFTFTVQKRNRIPLSGQKYFLFRLFVLKLFTKINLQQCFSSFAHIFIVSILTHDDTFLEKLKKKHEPK